jgi:hypothetical protein
MDNIVFQVADVHADLCASTDARAGRSVRPGSRA